MSASFLRITSGLYRGRLLKSPRGPTHPMGARERLALMNALSPHLPGATVLDAYAGTGALGLEALSRSARHATFIENHPAALAALRANIAALSASQTTVLPISVEAFPSHIASHLTFDIIFIDPPYDHFDPAEFSFLASYLAPGGHLALSHPVLPDPASIFLTLTHLSTRSYAAARLSLFHKT